MPVQFAKVLVPPPVAMPRGAKAACVLIDTAARIALAVWRRLERVGHERAVRELQRLAEKYAHQPELAQALRNAMYPPAMHGDGQH